MSGALNLAAKAVLLIRISDLQSLRGFSPGSVRPYRVHHCEWWPDIRISDHQHSWGMR